MTQQELNNQAISGGNEKDKYVLWQMNQISRSRTEAILKKHKGANILIHPITGVPFIYNEELETVFPAE